MAKATKKQALGRGLSALLNDPSNDIKSISDKNADKVIGSIVKYRYLHANICIPLRLVKKRYKPWLDNEF